MLRHQCSYWLTAEPGKNARHVPEEVINALTASDMAHPRGPLFFTLSGSRIDGEVNPRLGTIEEDKDLGEMLCKFSERFPDFRFELQEQDEEDKSRAQTATYVAGKCVDVSFSRTLDPGEIDRATLDGILQYLDSHGYHDAASALRMDFK